MNIKIIKRITAVLIIFVIIISLNLLNQTSFADAATDALDHISLDDSSTESATPEKEETEHDKKPENVVLGASGLIKPQPRYTRPTDLIEDLYNPGDKIQAIPMKLENYWDIIVSGRFLTNSDGVLTLDLVDSSTISMAYHNTKPEGLYVTTRMFSPIGGPPATLLKAKHFPTTSGDMQTILFNDLLEGTTPTDIEDGSKLWIDFQYGTIESWNPGVVSTADSFTVIINNEFIEPEVTINGGDGADPVYHPTSIHFTSNRNHGTDPAEPLRETTNIWGIEDESVNLVAGGRWNETTET